jgi:uncharacterized protein (TIGR03000 family)
MAQRGGGHGGGGHGGGGHGGGGHGGGGHPGGFHAGGIPRGGAPHAVAPHAVSPGVSHAHAFHDGRFHDGHFHDGRFHDGHSHHNAFFFGFGYPGFYGYGYPYYGYYPYYDSGYYGYRDPWYYGYRQPYAPYYDTPYIYPTPPSNYEIPVMPYADPVAHINVRVPANAELWFEGEKTTQKGEVRRFDSPPISPGQDYTYEIRAKWREGDHDVTQTRSVVVRGGQQAVVDFTQPARAEAPVVPAGTVSADNRK